MINLLPPEEKQNLSESKQLKTVFILGFIVFIFFISLALIFASISVSISSQVAAQKVLLGQKEQKFQTADVRDLKNKIIQINQNLTGLDYFYKQKASFADFLAQLSGILPGGTYLNSLSISSLKKENNLFQVTLSGHASSIEEVIGFNDNLKKDVKISKISFPGETWLEKQDFAFSVSFQAIISKQ